jgi:VWFA-related protein
LKIAESINADSQTAPALNPQSSMIRSVTPQFAAVIAAIALSAAQTPQTPVFRAGVDYVRVDVVVTSGADDRPVTDLTKDDFEIVEHGRPQTVNDFEYVAVPVGQRTGEAKAPSGPPPDVATNIAPSPKSRLFVMIVDDLHILESDIINVKKVMTDFIGALSPDDEVAIVFVGHSNLSQNFTTDRGLLLKTVDHVRDSLGFGLDALGRSSASNIVGGDPKIMHQYAVSADLVLKNVALSLGGSSHSRRAIVYVTGGSVVPSTFNGPGVGPDDFDELQDAYDTARRADVPIYTLDPRGQILADDVVRGGMSAIGGFDLPAGESTRARIAANIRQQNDRLAEVAINTGGLAFTNQSNLTRAVEHIVADNGNYYLLGYYPSPFDADGKFHEISVKVKRPGVRVRARTGYVASAVTSAAADAKPVLDTAMSAGVNVSAIALRAVASPMAPGAKGMKTVVTIEATYPARPDGSRQIDDELQMKILALDPDAKVKASSERTLHFKGTAPDQHAISLLIDDVVDLPSQPLTLRFGLSSRSLGMAGTVQMPVDVPKPSDD